MGRLLRWRERHDPEAGRGRLGQHPQAADRTPVEHYRKAGRHHPPGLIFEVVLEMTDKNKVPHDFGIEIIDSYRVLSAWALFGVSLSGAASITPMKKLSWG